MVRWDANGPAALHSRGIHPTEAHMKALVYHGPGQRSWDTVPDPAISTRPTSSSGSTRSTICGTDLHILKGDVPETTPGTVLGHEAVGTVAEIGAAVTSVAVGDRVLVSCISACGRCRFCKEARYGQCLGGGGWIFGHTDRRAAGRVRARAVRRQLRLQGARRRSATSRSCSSPTSSPPPTRSACSTAWSAPATSSRSSAPARSGWRRS